MTTTAASWLAELPGGGEPPLPPFEGETVPVGRQDLYVRSSGDHSGEPALFVHGLGGSSTNWTDLMALLAPRVEGRAIDLPGFGRSGVTPSGTYGMSDHATAVIDYLEQSGRGPVHLFGNSLGGAVSTRVAATRPDLVRTLTLISPALPGLRVRRGADLRLPLMLLPGVSGVLMKRLASLPAEQRARGTIELCFADPSRVAPQRMEEAAAEVARRNTLDHTGDVFLRSLKGLVSAQLQVGPDGLWAQAARVQARTLLVWGKQDRLVDVGIAPRAQKAFPDSRLVIFTDVGHVAQMERPVETAQAVTELLAGAGAGD